MPSGKLYGRGISRASLRLGLILCAIGLSAALGFGAGALVFMQPTEIVYIEPCL